MSKFIDKLNQASQAMPQPVGFRSSQPVPSKPKMLLIAGLAQANIDTLSDDVADADAGLLHIPQLSSGAKTLQNISQAMPNIPWGGWLGESGQGGIEQILKAGCDFVVFPAASTSLAILQDDGAGKILEVEPSLNEGSLRAINELPIDAVLIAGERKGDDFLTWHHLILFQRFANLLTKPLLVCIPPKVTSKELQALWEARVSGVIIEVEAGQPDRLKELRQTIDTLTFPSRRKWGKTEALLPYISRETVMEAEEEEEEEEE